MAAAPSPDGGATDIIHTLQSRHLLPSDVERRGRGCNAEGLVGWWVIIHSFVLSFIHPAEVQAAPANFPSPAKSCARQQIWGIQSPPSRAKGGPLTLLSFCLPWLFLLEFP